MRPPRCRFSRHRSAARGLVRATAALGPGANHALRHHPLRLGHLVIYNLDTDTPVGGLHPYIRGSQHFSQPDAHAFWATASPGLQHLSGADLRTGATVAEPPSNGPFASFRTITPGLVSATDLWQIGCTSRPSPNDPCPTSPLGALYRLNR